TRVPAKLRGRQAGSAQKLSERARITRLNGRVVLSIVVSADGTPRNMRVVRGLGLGLDESAMECVRTWRFRPV
ncbi:MAG: TonB family protein, partial [Acidobacteriia bacterium]|nr:TonB family protein [Terriglobia bacterium]